MRLEEKTAAATDPITVGHLRQWLAFQDGVDTDDTVLQEMIDDLIDDLESYTNRKIRTQTWYVYLDESEIGSHIRLPLVPVQSITAITAYDPDATTSTVTSTNYQFLSGEDPQIVLTEDGEWPTDLRSYDAFRIECVCGYGGSVVPFTWFEPADSSDAGLDDMTAALSDTWGGTARTTYEVKISTAAATDKFQWRAITTDSNGQKTYGAWSAETNITGAAQTVANNLTVTFGATTGHTVNDQWNIQMYEVLPRMILMCLKGLAIHLYETKGTGINQIGGERFFSIPRQFQRMMDRLRVGN